MRRTINIQVKGELAKYMVELLGHGQVRECKNLHLDQWPNRNHSVVCSKNWATQVPADRAIELDGYHVPSGYTFPQCPSDCPHFEKSGHFLKSVGRDQIDIQNEEWEEASMPEPIQVKPAGKVVQMPDKVTLRWLFDHVPASFWLWTIGTLLAGIATTFVLGVQSTRLKDVREFFGVEQKVAITPPSVTATPPAIGKVAAPTGITRK